MFGFSKKQKTTPLVALANGEFEAITEVSDPVFAGRAIGDGFAIEPSDGQIVAPVSGQVMSIFPTKHALMIKTKSGLEVLVHLGIDTVELKGAPFEAQVSEGDQVSAGQLVMVVDLAQIKASGKPATMMVVCSNGEFVGAVTPGQQLQTGDNVGHYTLKPVEK